MSMVGNDRGDEVCDAVIAMNPNMSHLTPAELQLMRDYYHVIYSADTTYIKANMDVLPTAHSGPNLNDPSGQTVTIPSTGNPGSPSSGSVTSSQDIAGKGSVD